MGNCAGNPEKKAKNGAIRSFSDPYHPQPGDICSQKVKICISGEVGVGKSLFYHTYFGSISKYKNSTTSGSGDISCRVVETPNIGKSYISIWDTAGQERYAQITQVFFRGSDGIIIMFDVTSPVSLKRIEEFWLKKIEEQIELASIKVCLVGNKTDLLDRVVTPEQGQAFASKHNMLYSETSALEGVGITETVEGLVVAIFQKRKMMHLTL